VAVDRGQGHRPVPRVGKDGYRYHVRTGRRPDGPFGEGPVSVPWQAFGQRPCGGLGLADKGGGRSSQARSAGVSMKNASAGKPNPGLRSFFSFRVAGRFKGGFTRLTRVSQKNLARADLLFNKTFAAYNAGTFGLDPVAGLPVKGRFSERIRRGLISCGIVFGGTVTRRSYSLGVTVR